MEANLRTPRQGTKLRVLNAKWAIILFLSFCFLQAFGMLVGIPVARYLTPRESSPVSEQLLAQHKLLFLTISIMVAYLFSAIITMVLAVTFFPRVLKQRGLTDAAFVLGSRGQLAMGAAMGFLVAAGAMLVNSIVSLWYVPTQLGTLTTASLSQGESQIWMTIVAVLFAPITEEPIFRGILFGGFTYSFGPKWGALLSTLLFLLMHLPEFIHFWPYAIALTALSGITLFLRLRTQAIGPCVAAHFTYNLLVMGAATVLTNFR